MDRAPTTEPRQPLATTLHRGFWLLLVPIFWLLAVPACCAFGPWVVDSLATTDPVSGSFSSTTLQIQAFIPVFGLFGVLGFRFRATYPVRLLPYLPYAAAAVSYLVALTVVATADDSDGVLEETTDWYPDAEIVAGLCHVLLPFLALVGGVVAFIAWVKHIAELGE